MRERETTTSRSALALGIADARASLVATLESLDDESWAAPSLCDGWAVRDVVGHLLHQYDIYRAPYPRLALFRAGLRVNRFLALEARRVASSRTNADLLTGLSACEYERTMYWRFTPWPEFGLTEFIVHGQDIRRPLGITAMPATSHVVRAADVFVGRGRANPFRRMFQRALPRVRFQATDHEWAWGDGALARGPLEAILMVLAGRAQALEDLSGHGVAQLERALSSIERGDS